MEQKLKEYAALLAKVGLNIQPGQTLVISSPVECAYFARLCASAAYDCGCREVVMNWRDDVLTREKCLRADDAVFDEVPAWRSHFYNDYAKAGAAYLSIAAEDPENLLGVDPDRLVRSQRASGKAMADFYRLQMSSGFPWCIASIPIPSWAKRVFPDVPEAEAMEQLWEAIFHTMRITGDGQSAQRWQEHIAMLAQRREKLNALRFKTLHYTNALGTDLTIELPEGHIWEAGDDETQAGQFFVANMPTEEIFTAPLREGINGVVYASMPLVHDGNIIDDFHFVIEKGKIVEAVAGKGQDVLRSAISVDEGACYFGEVALVPYDSPISNLKILFYNTLFDENAACHLAFGEAYPCIEGGRDMTKEQLKEKGLNDSITHVDFMIGTADLKIVGTTHDGREVDVFVNGNFAL